MIFDRQRLGNNNLMEYLTDIMGAKPKQVEHKALRGFTSLLQKDYGGRLDCTLTSLTMVEYFKHPDYTPWELYDDIENIAKKYFYSPSIYGTIPIFIKSIHENIKTQLSDNSKTYFKFIKNITYNIDTIKKCINKNTPVILSMMNDGRNYYKNHSVVIIGYSTYEINNTTKDILIIYDNWSNMISYIDYSRLPTLTAINY